MAGIELTHVEKVEVKALLETIARQATEDAERWELIGGAGASKDAWKRYAEQQDAAWQGIYGDTETLLGISHFPRGGR